VDNEGRIEEPLRVSVGLIAVLTLACFVSAVALSSNVCGLFRLPIWLGAAFGLAVLAILWRAFLAVQQKSRSWRVSSDRWDFAEIAAFVSFGLLAWHRRTGTWSFNLPSSQSVDAVHHLALADYLSRTNHIPRGVVAYLGPMVGYPPGSHIFAVFVQHLSRSTIASALTFTSWWICIAWGFFIGGIARLAIGERRRWIGIASFPILCVASQFMLGQVTEQFYFAQIMGGFVFLAFILVLCLRAELSVSTTGIGSSNNHYRHENLMFRAIGMLLLASLPAIYPLGFVSSGAVVGFALIPILLGRFRRFRRFSLKKQSAGSVVQKIDPQSAHPQKIVTARIRRFFYPLEIEVGWLLAGAALGIALWLPLGLATSNTMISQEGGLAEPSLRNFGGPITLAVGSAGVIWLLHKARRIGSDHATPRNWVAGVVLLSLASIGGQIALLSVGKGLGFSVTRYYVLKGIYFGVPLSLVVVLCGSVWCVERLEVALRRRLGSPNLTAKRVWREPAIQAGRALVAIATVMLLLILGLSASPLQSVARSFDPDVVWLAKQARVKLPGERLGVVADPATSYLLWNALFRQQRTDDPLETFDSFAKTNRFADWPSSGSERYLLTTNVLAAQYLKNSGVRIAGVRGDAVLLSSEDQGRVRRVTKGALVLMPRTDAFINVTSEMREAFPPSASNVRSRESATDLRKLLELSNGSPSRLPDYLVSEDGFRLAAMSRSAAAPLSAVLFAEALRVGQYDVRVTAAITELVAVANSESNSFVSDGAIDPAAMFAWASISPNERLVSWRSQYLSLASLAEGRHSSIAWSSLVPTTKEPSHRIPPDSVALEDDGVVSAAKACGAKLNPRRTLALRALAATLARRIDLQSTFGIPRNPKLGALIEWASNASDSDAAQLLPYWPELQVITVACR
jgi:hypothetical protein